FCFSPCRLHPRGQAAHVWPRAQARTRSTAAKITRAAIRSRSALDGILPTRPGLHPGGQEAPLSYRISADIRQIPATADLLMKQDGHRTAARCVSCPSQERYRSSRDRRDRRRFASCSRGTHWSKEKDPASSAAWRAPTPLKQRAKSSTRGSASRMCRTSRLTHGFAPQGKGSKSGNSVAKRSS